MKLRLAQPAVLVDIGRHRRPVVRARRRRQRAHRRAHPPPRPRHVRPARASRCRCWPRWPARSATRRCGTAARSAARSPTATRPRTCRPRCWRSGHARRPGSGRRAHDRRRRLLHRLPRDGARARRAAHRDPGPGGPGAGCAFQKFNRRAQDWAIVGVAAVLTQRATGPASAWSTWARRRCGPPASRRRCERRVGGRRRRPRRRGHRAARRPQRLARVPPAPRPGPRPPGAGTAGA